MDITQNSLEADITVVCLKGRLDATASKRVKQVLHQLVENNQLKIVIDLQQVPFIDSSGLVALVSGLRLAREQNGNIVLCGVQTQAQMVFRLTMLDRIFSMHPTLEDASQALI